jgi:uncharacterized secreted protein with C-terminal beta-propeller domain
VLFLSAPGGEAAKPADAQRAVEEADIIQRDGSRLYALSRYGGLSVIEIGVRDELKMLGRYRMDAMPFEMYVKDGVVQVMLNDFGHWVQSTGPDGGRWVQSSEILSLDARNPASIQKLASFDVPGAVSDSRLVGDVLYLVTFEDGYCWRCQDTPSTTITSFKTAGTAIAQVDQIRFSSPQKSYSWWKRSVSATNQRLYVAGPEWTWNGSGNQRSVVQIVDISNPSGALRKGVDVPVDGQIDNRWQMDEYEGVLRVVSQRGNGWSNGSVDPQVQTFRVTDATTVALIGQTSLKLPKPESLRSVRFDGPRGYAITAQQTDPLYTIDLADPTRPKQMGTLEMPGFLYYMEPRGDRLVGLGYDNRNSEGSLTVSLFDVADLAAPKMLKRVNFAKGWANLAEDQDRIHKSFQVLDAQNLIMVPFASYGGWRNNGCVAPASGIQLIDYTHDDLVLRGVAPQHGQPRRAFIYDERLFAVSDNNVTSFRFDNRDAPAKTAEFALSNPAHNVVATPGGMLAQLTNDWFTGEAMVALTPKDNADLADPVGSLALTALSSNERTRCGGYGSWTSWYAARLFSNGNFVYVAVPTYSYGPDYNSSQRSMLVGVIDISNPKAPTLVGKTEVVLPKENYWGGGWFDGYAFYSGGYYGSLVGAGSAIVQSGSTLAFIDSRSSPILGGDGRAVDSRVDRTIYTLNFAQPSSPSLAKTDLPASVGATPLILQGSTVYTSRWQRTQPGRVRFYVDRLDIANPSAPTLRPAVNVPGSLLAVDASQTRLTTVDYRRNVAGASTYQDCANQSGYRAYFDNDAKTCTTVDRMLRLVDLPAGSNRASLRSTTGLPGQNVGGIVATDERVYVTLYADYDYSSSTATPGGGGGVYQEPKLRAGSQQGLFVYSGVSTGTLSLTSSFIGAARWPVAVAGTRVAIANDNGLSVYDTASSSPKLLGAQTLRGYGYSYDVLLEQDRAICALGEWGLQTISLR